MLWRHAPNLDFDPSCLQGLLHGGSKKVTQTRSLWGKSHMRCLSAKWDLELDAVDMKRGFPSHHHHLLSFQRTAKKRGEQNLFLDFLFYMPPMHFSVNKRPNPCKIYLLRSHKKCELWHKDRHVKSRIPSRGIRDFSSPESRRNFGHGIFGIFGTNLAAKTQTNWVKITQKPPKK